MLTRRSARGRPAGRATRPGRRPGRARRRACRARAGPVGTPEQGHLGQALGLAAGAADRGRTDHARPGRRAGRRVEHVVGDGAVGAAPQAAVDPARRDPAGGEDDLPVEALAERVGDGDPERSAWSIRPPTATSPPTSTSTRQAAAEAATARSAAKPLAVPPRSSLRRAGARPAGAGTRRGRRARPRSPTAALRAVRARRRVLRGAGGAASRPSARHTRSARAGRAGLDPRGRHWPARRRAPRLRRRRGGERPPPPAAGRRSAGRARCPAGTG